MPSSDGGRGRADVSPAAVAMAAELAARCAFPEDGRALRCGVSGGADSLALLVLACVVSGDVTAVHVDHGLRPGSHHDAAVVRAVADRLGARCEVVRVEVGDGPNLEARARSARLAALGVDAALGHTADDRAEGVLLALLRGAGPHGVGVLRPDARHPILRLRRADTERLCAAWDLVPVEDPTNRQRRFTRNRVRHEVLPLLADVVGRDPVPLLVRHAEQCGALDDHVESVAGSVLADPSDARAVAAVAATDEVVAVAALRRWLRAASVEGYPPDAAAVARVLAVARGERRATEVAGGWRVVRSGGRLRLEAPTEDSGSS